MPETNPEQSYNPPNPFVSLLQNFRLSFPFPANPQSDSQDSSANKTDVVIFTTDPRPAVPPPLKIESDESSQRSAAVVWQVYALGGYLLARWIWGKWKEKRNNDQPPSDENTSPPSN
ncbi:unnamed protein product [Rhodiola kirilowii]